MLVRYDAAAALRDQLKEVAARADAAADRASAAQAGCVERTFKLGQRVVHARDSYQGVIFG